MTFRLFSVSLIVSALVFGFANSQTISVSFILVVIPTYEYSVYMIKHLWFLSSTWQFEVANLL